MPEFVFGWPEAFFVGLALAINLGIIGPKIVRQFFRSDAPGQKQ